MIRHNHITRDIKPEGQCPACDLYHKKTFKVAVSQTQMNGGFFYSCVFLEDNYKPDYNFLPFTQVMEISREDKNNLMFLADNNAPAYQLALHKAYTK